MGAAKNPAKNPAILRILHCDSCATVSGHKAVQDFALVVDMIGVALRRILRSSGLDLRVHNRHNAVQVAVQKTVQTW